MAKRQTRNVSLPSHQDAFVDEMVASGRYRRASEVVRDGLRLLQEAEHRRLVEAWLYRGLSPAEEERLPDEIREGAVERYRLLIEEALEDVRCGRVSDGPEAMERLRNELEARCD